MAYSLACALMLLAACGGDVVIMQDAQLDSTSDSVTMDQASDSPCEGAEAGAACTVGNVTCAGVCCARIPGWSCVDGVWQVIDVVCECIK